MAGVNDQSRYSIGAAERVCDILDLLRDSPGGVSLVQVAHAVDLPRATAYRYMSTLDARRYVQHDAERGLYRTGIALRRIVPSHDEVRAGAARPHLETCAIDSRRRSISASGGEPRHVPRHCRESAFDAACSSARRLRHDPLYRPRQGSGVRLARESPSTDRRTRGSATEDN